MLDFCGESIDSKLKKIQGIPQTFMLANLLFTKVFFSIERQKYFNSRHYMLDFPLFMAVTLANYYLLEKDKYQILYVISSYILELLTIIDTIEQEVELISKILCQLSTGDALILNKIKQKGYFRHSCQHLCSVRSFWFVWRQRRHLIADILCQIFHCSWHLFQKITMYQQWRNSIYSMLFHPVFSHH